MKYSIPLDDMTIAEKLSAMEKIWKNLRQNPENLPSPDWHGEELSDRESRLDEGNESFSDLSAAKKKLRKETE